MKFDEKLKKTMQDLNITQKQLVAMTGIGKSSISQYLSGKNIPTEERQKNIALSLGLDADYFKEMETVAAVPVIISVGTGKGIKKLMVEDAAKILGMNHNTVRKGLQQGVFPWGYAIKTSEHRWVYFINAKRFAEIEGVTV
jgi:transcriptional regulator with XRE-family HTH domain